MFAWSVGAPEVVHPVAPEVAEIGETGLFKTRIDEFRTSAGFLGERGDGHSTGWRWPEVGTSSGHAVRIDELLLGWTIGSS